MASRYILRAMKISTRTSGVISVLTSGVAGLGWRVLSSREDCALRSGAADAKARVIKNPGRAETILASFNCILAPEDPSEEALLLFLLRRLLWIGRNLRRRVVTGLCTAGRRRGNR